MSPEYILRASLCRKPFCAGPHDLRDKPLKEWPESARANVRRSAECEIENIGYAPDYAERGYTSPEKGILFANWNYFPRDVYAKLESYGYALEWSDEWATCGHCCKAFRTTADSYGWQPAGVITNGGDCVCEGCFTESDIADFEDSPSYAFNFAHLDLAEFGYQKIEGDFESGFHPGQTDDSEEIFKRLQAAGHERIVFQVDTVGQFDIRFSVWEKIPESD